MTPDPRAVTALYALGHWLLGQGRSDDALHVFRTMMSVAPNDERSWLGLARAHESKGQDAIAAELHALAVEANPSSFRCALAHARALREAASGDAEAAFEIAEERARAAGEDEAADAIATERSAA